MTKMCKDHNHKMEPLDYLTRTYRCSTCDLKVKESDVADKGLWNAIKAEERRLALMELEL